MIPFRTKNDPFVVPGGRSVVGKMLVAGAVEIDGGKPRRARLEVIEGFGKPELHTFALGGVARRPGWSPTIGPPNQDLPGVRHKPIALGPMAAHIASPSTHRLFSNLKRWGLGVSHGLRKTDLQHYLDEFIFRFNRRQTRRAAFETLLSIGARTLRHPTTSGSANTPNPTTISTTGLSCISLSHNSFSGFPGFAGDFSRNPQTGYVKLTQPVISRGLRI